VCRHWLNTNDRTHLNYYRARWAKKIGKELQKFDAQAEADLSKLEMTDII
jgi:hypothetical protein